MMTGNNIDKAQGHIFALGQNVVASLNQGVNIDNTAKALKIGVGTVHHEKVKMAQAL